MFWCVCGLVLAALFVAPSGADISKAALSTTLRLPLLERGFDGKDVQLGLQTAISSVVQRSTGPFRVRTRIDGLGEPITKRRLQNAVTINYIIAVRRVLPHCVLPYLTSR